MLEWLRGKKTYIVVIVGVLVNGAYAMGYLSEDWVKTIDAVLLFLGLGTVRAGISKMPGNPVLVLPLLFFLGGCALPGVYSGMQAAEIEAMSKVKDAAVLCIKGAGPPMTGQGTLVFASIDKGVFASILVNENCGTTIDNSFKPAPKPVP